MSNSEPTFKPGDRVGWSHSVSTKHAKGSIIYSSVFLNEHVKSEVGDGIFGTIIKEDIPNQWEVKLDGHKKSVVLTSDELVKVEAN